MGVIRRSDILPENFQGDFMQKKIIGTILAIVIIAAGFYIVENTRLFKDSPNVIVILTDDLDYSLMPYMEKTNKLIGDQGATFTNFFVTTPACCPSRTSIIRGQYSHNTDILENSPGFPRFFKLNQEENALPVWLNKAGYQTALFGKYMNNYPINAGMEYVPPGWTDWGAFVTTEVTINYYYNYTMNENGTLVKYGDAPEDYSTDVVRNKSLQFIDERAQDELPFFLFISVYAPHGPSTAAPRHETLFNDLAYPQKPSFREEDLSDKPELIRALTETGDDFDEGDANSLFRARARSLQAADELVEDVILALEKNGQLENTYIIFTSDNGFHLGEHRIPSGKGTPYEEDIRVPFFIRGPGIEPGTTFSQLSANIDIAPTIADIVSVQVPDFVDGRSFLPFLLGRDMSWRQALLIEFGQILEYTSSDSQSLAVKPDPSLATFVDPETDNLLSGIGGGSFRGIRTDTFIFVKYENGELEYYDLLTDPYQLENTANQLDPETLEQLQKWLDQLKRCSGHDCRKFEQSPPQGILD
jgi:N-acetylglucosamine-6-sulfatase